MSREKQIDIITDLLTDFDEMGFEDFIIFAKGQTFDYRSSAKALFDGMKRELEMDGLTEMMKEELLAVDKAIEIDKEQMLRLNKNEIIPFIEEEIVTRYWFQEAGVEVRLRYDEQLKTALVSEMIG